MNAIQYFQWGDNSNNDVEITFANKESYNYFDKFSINTFSLYLENRERNFETRLLVGRVVPSAKKPLVWILKRQLLLNLNEHLDLEFRGIYLDGAFEGSVTIEVSNENAGVFLNNKNVFPADRGIKNKSYFEIEDKQTLKIDVDPYKYNLPTLQQLKTQLTKIIIPRVFN